MDAISARPFLATTSSPTSSGSGSPDSAAPAAPFHGQKLTQTLLLQFFTPDERRQYLAGCNADAVRGLRRVRLSSSEFQPRPPSEERTARAAARALSAFPPGSPPRHVGAHVSPLHQPN